MKYYSKAIRLSDMIVRDIWGGCFELGKYLPGEDALAERYSVSRATIRRVLEILGTEGVVIKEPNRGSLINPELKRETLPEQNPAPTPREAGQFTIGAVWASFPDAHTIGIGEGIRSYARENELHFHLFQSIEGHEQTLETLRRIDEAGVNGIITLPFNSDGYIDSLRRLKERAFPVVCVDRPIEGVEFSCVEVDNFTGVYSAVVRMIMDSRRPVYYLGAVPEHRPQKLRLEGFLHAMNDSGFDGDLRKYIIDFPAGDSNPAYWPTERKQDAPFQVSLEFLRHASFPLNIMAMNDYAAYAVCKAAEKLKLVIGHHVAIFGFDDLPLASCMECPLSSVRQPRFEIGYEAARMLHDQLLGKTRLPIRKTLPVELIERASSRLV